MTAIASRDTETFFTDDSRLTHDLKRRFDDLLFNPSRAFAALGELSGMVDRAWRLAEHAASGARTVLTA